MRAMDDRRGYARAGKLPVHFRKGLRNKPSTRCRFVPQFQRNIAVAPVLLGEYASNTFRDESANHEAGHNYSNRPRAAGERACMCEGGKPNLDQFSRDRPEGARWRIRLVAHFETIGGSPEKRPQRFKRFIECQIVKSLSWPRERRYISQKRRRESAALMTSRSEACRPAVHRCYAAPRDVARRFSE